MQIIIKNLLQRLAILLKVLKLFFPGILFVTIGYIFFTGFLQGKDIIITGLRSRQTSLFFITGMCFWVLVTWYTSRLIAYNDDRLYTVAKDAQYKMPRILGFACFTVIITSLALIHFKASATYIQLMCIVISVIHFQWAHPLFERIKRTNDRNKLIRYRQFIWGIFLFIIFMMVYSNQIHIYIALLLIMQTGFLFIAVTRRKISESSTKHTLFPTWLPIAKQRKQYHQLIKWLFTDKEAVSYTHLTLPTNREV